MLHSFLMAAGSIMPEKIMSLLLFWVRLIVWFIHINISEKRSISPMRREMVLIHPSFIYPSNFCRLLGMCWYCLSNWNAVVSFPVLQEQWVFSCRRSCGPKAIGKDLPDVNFCLCVCVRARAICSTLVHLLR